MLFFLLEILLNDVAKIVERLSGNQLVCQRVVAGGENFLPDLLQGNRVVRLFGCEFFNRKIRRKYNCDLSRFAAFLSDNLFAELRKEIIGSEMHPEFFAAVQILACLRCDFGDRLAVDQTFKVDHRKVSHLQFTLWNNDKISGLIAQPFQRGIDLRLGHFGIRQLDGNILVFRKLEFWRGYDRRAKAHRLVLAQLDIFNIGQ